MTEFNDYISLGKKYHEEVYEDSYIIPDERTLLSSHRYATCAKCGKEIPPAFRWSIEYPNGPLIYFHEACLNELKNKLAEVYEAALKSILKNLGSPVG